MNSGNERRGWGRGGGKGSRWCVRAKGVARTNWALYPLRATNWAFCVRVKVGHSAASSWGGKQAPPFFSSDGQACDVWDPDTASCVISFTVSSTSHRWLCYSQPAACQPAAVFNFWNRSDTRALWRLPGRAPKPSRCLFLYITGQRLPQPQKPYLWKYLPSPAAQILRRVPRHTMHLRRAGFGKSKSCRLDYVATFLCFFRRLGSI